MTHRIHKPVRLFKQIIDKPITSRYYEYKMKKGAISLKQTPIRYRNLVIYQIFVRNHTQEGTFQAVIEDFPRIKQLGVDVLYLLPIHPIGVIQRKGTLGSPYSIQDYRAISPDLGSMDDFTRFIHSAHEWGFMVFMDIVFNHTSRDSVLLKHHPEWFYRNSKGEFANRVGDWWDITDLDYNSSKQLWHEMADILSSYATMGIDGFRCDVASLVPLDFWKYARKQVSRVNSQVIWFSESVHGGFIKYLRDQGIKAASEAEIYQVFDLAYDYDIYPYYEDYLLGKRPLKDYLEALVRQEEIYPENYVKVKYADNHDFRRLASFVANDIAKFKNWLSFLFFQKGAMMLYAGVEFASDHLPNLFEKDVRKGNEDLSALVSQLAKWKKHRLFKAGILTVHPQTQDGVAVLDYQNESHQLIGVFNVGQSQGMISIPIPDGFYINQISRKRVKVAQQMMPLIHDPIVIYRRK